MALAFCAETLDDAGVPKEIVEDMNGLARQVGHPCVLAVVGAVKAGKSTFINALLGQECAVVGDTETTATINYISYGQPDPSTPVLCHWRDGRATTESQAFLASLQGTDEAALKRAEGIDHLEYFVANPLLRRVTLVDTPGTGSVVGHHEQRTAAYLRLRERHDLETRRMRETADAIVYVVGAVAMGGDKQILEQFTDASGGAVGASKALGVLGKIDLSKTLVDRRHELCAKIASQLSTGLHSVLPVGGALANLIALADASGEDPLDHMSELVARIPGDQLSDLLADEQLFCTYDHPGWPVSAAERQSLRTMLPANWSAFATLVELASTAKGPLRPLLVEVAGIEKVKQVLTEQMFERGHILRCFRIVRDARTLLNDVRFRHLAHLRRRATQNQRRLERFLNVVTAIPDDPDTVAELQSYLTSHLSRDLNQCNVENAWERTDAVLSELWTDLHEHHADFEALQTLDRCAESFTTDEQAELRALLGMYGSAASVRLGPHGDPDYCIGRQLHWRRIEGSSLRGSPRALLAERAVARLGLLIDDFNPDEAAPAERANGNPRRARDDPSSRTEHAVRPQT
jgi:hypothetical protein